MPLIVGNLLTDPEAQSFISLTDAVAYLEAEAAGQLTGTPIGDWITLDASEQEATLSKASRWMALTLPWRPCGLSDDNLIRVGQAAARLAMVSLTTDLWATEAVGKAAKRYKAGTVEIEYQDASRTRGAIAGGKRFPWLYPMLRGLIGGGNQHDVARR